MPTPIAVITPANADRVSELARWDDGPVVLSVAFAPDGQTLASWSSDNTVRLWRVSDGSLLRTLSGHGNDVFSMAFAPDGQSLASGSDDNTVRLWRVSDGSLLRALYDPRIWMVTSM